MENTISRRRWSLSFSEDVVLRKKSIGKDPSKLTRKDYKTWFVRLYWEKSKGIIGGIETDCSNISDVDVQNLISGMHK